MGVSIGKAQWAYTFFAEFRRKLAAAEGIDLDYMSGFGLPVDVARPWDEVSTPLRSWPETGDLVQDYDRINGLALAEDMRAAAAAGRRLEFH